MIKSIYVEIRSDYRSSPMRYNYNWMFGTLGDETRLNCIRKSDFSYYALGVF